MPIAAVGSPVAVPANNGTDVTLTLPTLAEGDVVVVIGGKSRSTVGSAAGPSTSGYTQIESQVNTSSATNPQLGAWYKRMGSTPDTSVTCLGGGATSDAAGYIAYCRRGVDATTPLDVAAVVAASTVDPPSITTVSNGAEVFAAAASGTDDSTPGDLSGYTTTVFANQTDTRPYTVAAATKVLTTAGAENPPAFPTFTATSVPQALTFALRPAPSGPAPVTGTLSGSVPKVTGSMSGTVAGPVFTGTLAGAVLLATGSLTGAVAGPVYMGTLSGSVPRVTGAITGTAAGPVVTGTLAGSTPKLTGSLSGTVTAPAGGGTLAGSLPLVTGNLVGTVTAPTYTGTLTGSVPRVTGSLAGTVAAPTYTGTLAGTLPVVVGSLVGTVVGAQPAGPDRHYTATRLPPEHTATRLAPTHTARRLDPEYAARRIT